MRNFEVQFKTWTVKIDAITSLAQKSKGWANIDLRQRIDDLKIQRALFETKLKKIQRKGVGWSEDLRIELEQAMKDLEIAFDKIIL